MPSTHLLRFSRADGGGSEASSREGSVVDHRGSTDDASRRGSVHTMPSVDESPPMAPPPPTPVRPAAPRRMGSYGEGRLSRMIETARMQGGNPLTAISRGSSAGSGAFGSGRFAMPNLGRSPTSTSVGATSTEPQSKRNEVEVSWRDEPSERDERDEGAPSEPGSSPGTSFTRRHSSDGDEPEADPEAGGGGLELASVSSCIGPFASIREASRSQEMLMTRM